MNEILIITGACGVGKSTISKEWAKLKNGAIIECDFFTEWIFKKDFPHWTPEVEKMEANMSVLLAKEYLKYGMPVAIENVWTPAGLEILINNFTNEQLYKLTVVWLFCELQENQRRDKLRIPDNQMLERVEIVNKELANYQWPDYLSKIDTTNLSINETVNLIEESPSLNLKHGS